MQIICDFHMEFSINVYTSCIQINHWKSYRLRMIIFFHQIMLDVGVRLK